ncbi:RNA 2',3'-cyclic phosphodiesterase [Aneurinibacillus sp. UBA3580]|uniref:RNA 2',3'-cyclic phosphodiesterase n=1 Tax=Aneurinibacillus sp. UBA3580 TaxID=1946041 RepID=UPI00257CEF56|nr:RNA 2',3'-cyclic phosphodiesterase [Aneurinibacillus sp. UBA3580]
MRLFTAIELSQEVKQELIRLQKELKNGPLACRRWQTMAQMHLTLHFFGECSAEQTQAIKKEMAQATASVSPFSIQLTNLGAFPNIKRPRVVWAGIGGQIENLHALQQLLTDRFVQAQLYKEERSYSPHITLGRDPDMTGETIPVEKLIQIRSIAWRVDSIVLFQSTLTRSGPIYKPLVTCPLLGSS